MSAWRSINHKPRVQIRIWGFSVRPLNSTKEISRPLPEQSRVHPLFTWTHHLHAGAK